MHFKIINWFLFLLFVLLLVSLFRSVDQFRQREGILKEAETKLQDVKQEQNDLKKQLARAESKQFIEKQARDKLNLGREGEIVVILPSISVEAEPTPSPIDVSANWQKWAKVFVYGK